jgi:protein-tyrosine phosphatase
MITQITPQVSIGDSQDATSITNDKFDCALNVAIDLDIGDTNIKRHKVGLLDGPGNDPALFISAVIVLYSLAKSGKRILIHCHEGKSRSVMVCSAFLAVQELTTLDDALAKIMPLRKVDIYRPALYAMAQSTIPIIKDMIKKIYDK